MQDSNTSISCSKTVVASPIPNTCIRTESSLTTPEDRDKEKRWLPSQGSSLTKKQTTRAMTELNIDSFVRKFPKTDRCYADPPLPLQTIGLFSFVPAQGATPNENGIFGMAKLRGNFATDIEANSRAATIIKNADSYHKIYHTYVGRPFPVTVSSKYSAETEEIDIRKEINTTMSLDIKDQKAKEQESVKDIKTREDNLLSQSKIEVDDPYDMYITLKVKKAQLTWTFLEHTKKMSEVKSLILSVREKISKTELENPGYKDSYFEKYMAARKAAGLKETDETSSDNFMKYMVEEKLVPGIDC